MEQPPKRWDHSVIKTAIFLYIVAIGLLVGGGISKTVKIIATPAISTHQT